MNKNEQGNMEEQLEENTQQQQNHESIAPQSPATLAIQNTMKNMPPKPESNETETEVVAFRRLLHDSSQEYNVKQSENDRETLASLTELQTRFLIDSNMASRSQQLNAQIELHHDFIAKFLWNALKQKSLEQRNSVSGMIDKVTELLQDCLDRQTVEFRQHIRWLKGVCEAKVDAARQAGNNTGHDVLRKCEILFGKEIQNVKKEEASKREEMAVEIETLKQELISSKRKAQTRGDTLTKMLNEQKTEVKKLMKEKAKLEYRFETEGQELIKLEKKLKSANDIIQQKSRNEDKLNIQIVDLTNKNKSIRDDLYEAKFLYEGLLKERDELQLKCTEMENALSENADATAGLQKRIAQAKEIDRIHKEEVLSLKQDIENVQAQLKHANKRVEDIAKSKEIMVKKKKKMEKEFQALADEVVQCRSEVVQLNMNIQGLEKELSDTKLKQLDHEEKKHEHSSGVFNKVKNALNILKKLHKDKGKSTKAETKKAAKVDSAALFEQAMASGTSNDEDEEKKKREKKHGKRLDGIHGELQMELEEIHETTEVHLTGGVADKKLDLKKQQEKFDLMRKNMEKDIRAQLEVSMRRILKREFHEKMEKSMRSRLEGEIGRRFKAQMRKKIEEAIARIKMKPDAMRDALEAERRRVEVLEKVVEEREEEIMQKEKDLDAKARGAAELALLVREKDMLLTELTLLVRAYKGEVKELKDNIEETASGAWIPPVAKKTFLRPQTAKLRPYSRESARGFTPQRRTGTAESRSNHHTQYWKQQPSANQDNNDRMEQSADEENQNDWGDLMKEKHINKVKRAKSASATKRKIRVSRLGGGQKINNRKRNNLSPMKRTGNVSGGFRPVTAGPALGRRQQDTRNLPEENDEYKPNVLLRTALKESFFTPQGVLGGVDQNAITVDTLETRLYMKSHNQKRPHTAGVLNRSKTVPSIVFGASGLQALVERGKFRNSRSQHQL